MVKESAGSWKQEKGNPSLLSKDRQQWGWKWKVGAVGTGMWKWRVVEPWIEGNSVCPQARSRVQLLCLSCNFNVEPLPGVPQSPRSLCTIPRTWETATPLVTGGSAAWAPAAHGRTQHTLFLMPSSFKAREPQIQGGNFYQEKRWKHKWNRIVRNTWCEGAEKCKVVFLLCPSAW